MWEKAKILKTLRWTDWATDKLPFFCITCFYICLAYSTYSLIFIRDFFVFIAFASISSLYGYLVNEFGDKEPDTQEGKSNTFKNISNAKAVSILSILFLLTILTGILFVGKSYFIYLWMTQLFLATFYSLKPIRFKERRSLGIVAACFAQSPLPIMLLFSAFGVFGGWDMWAIACCATVVGLAKEIGHQAFDSVNDAKSGTLTLGSKIGVERMTKFYRKALFTERISWAVFMMIILVKVPPMSFYYTFSPVLPIVFLFAVLLLRTVYLDINNLKKKDFYDPYYRWELREWTSPYNLLHVYFPHVILPIYLTLIMTFNYSPFLIIFTTLLFFINFNYSDFSTREHLSSLFVIFYPKGSNSRIFNLLKKKIQHAQSLQKKSSEQRDKE
ncbi:MAG: UbiA family prenyltransferase [PVC group bacterium]|nr:UbiA family prenyltransferase [PVC group bacterium]